MATSSITKVEVCVVATAVLLLFFLSTAHLHGQLGGLDAANKAQCANNLKQLQGAILSYFSSKGRRRHYPNYSEKEYLILKRQHASKTNGLKFIECLYMGKSPILTSENVLICPSNKNHVANVFKKNKEGNFDIGKSAYLYRNTAEGYAIVNKNPSKQPLVADRAKNHEGGLNIVFLDGHVEFLPLESGYFYKDDNDPNSPLSDSAYSATDKKRGADRVEKSAKPKDLLVP